MMTDINGSVNQWEIDEKVAAAEQQLADTAAAQAEAERRNDRYFSEDEDGTEPPWGEEGVRLGADAGDLRGIIRQLQTLDSEAPNARDVLDMADQVIADAGNYLNAECPALQQPLSIG